MKALIAILKYFSLVVLTLAVFVFCIIFGSTGLDLSYNIIVDLRLPRVLTVAFIGASLSVAGAAMQGLLRNPLADGTTLGVSSGAGVGAVVSIIITNSLSSFIIIDNLIFSNAITIIFSLLFSFISLLLVMLLSYRFDRNLSTNTIILVGVIFSMFASSLISFLITMFPENAKSITFWTMGSVTGVGYGQVVLVAISTLVCSIILITKSKELNSFALGEENASHIGVNVKFTKILIMICVSVLVGTCVAVSGTIGFVGLVVPHISRMIIGPNHKYLLPFSIIFGSNFLMIMDLLSRTIAVPKELPIGVITSLIGAVVFCIVFFRQKR